LDGSDLALVRRLASVYAEVAVAVLGLVRGGNVNAAAVPSGHLPDQCK